MENQLISIIIPSFNAGPYIEKCLKSIQEQTYNSIQIIVVDDMSADDTVDRIQKLQAKDKRICLIQLEKNSGSAVARQTGINKSSGDLITFVDADDWYCNCNALKRIVETYNETKADCIMFSYRTVHKYGKVSKKKFNGRTGVYSSKQVAEAKSCAPSPHWHYLWNKCFKGDILKSGAVKFHAELRHGEDVRFNADFLRCAQTFYVMNNEYFYDYNCANLNQITRRTIEKTLDNQLTRYKQEKEELFRLLDDYSVLGVSEIAIDGLYAQFFSNVTALKINNYPEYWSDQLNNQINNDDTYLECIRRLGVKSNLIVKKAKQKKRINGIRNFIKRKLKL